MTDVKNPQSITVEIIIKGSTSPQMEGWFEGLSMITGEGNSSISGTLPDQQALYGLVNYLRDLGVSILSIKMDPIND